MKLNIFMFKNKYLRCFTQPIFDDHEKDVYSTNLSRFLLSTKEENKVNNMKHLDLYYLGSFDDQTGIIIPVEPELLCDCSDIIAQRQIEVKSSDEKN